MKEYDFWGHCDCDLIFGDIRKFVTEAVLDNYKKIFTRGHLTIYHNDPETNAFYRTQGEKNIRKIYGNPHNVAFDEWPGISNIWKQCGGGYYDAMPFDDIIAGLDGFYPTKRNGKNVHGGPYHEGNTDESERFKRMRHITYQYNKGNLFRLWLDGHELCSEEILYVHLQKRNMDIRLKDDSIDLFVICSDAFLDYKENIMADELKKISPDKITLNNMYRKLRSFVRLVINKIR